MHDVSVFIGVSNTPVDGHRRLSVFYSAVIDRQSSGDCVAIAFCTAGKDFGDGHAEFRIWTLLGCNGSSLSLRTSIRCDIVAPTSFCGGSKKGRAEERSTEER
jgi:hypothetical protein